MTQRRRGNLLLGSALILALATALLTYNYVSGLERSVGEKVRVLVAAKDIPSSTLIKPDMLGVQEAPLQYLQAYASSYIGAPAGDTTSAAAGRLLGSEQFITMTPIKKGSIIQRDLLYTAGQIASGMRAVTIGVSPVTSVGGGIRAGSRVDIVVSYSDEGDTGARGSSRTLVLLQDVLVLAVGTTSSEGGSLEGVPVVGGLLPSGEMAKSVTVTVALPPDDAMRLIYMDNFAKEVRLVLRRTDERERPNLQPVTPHSFPTE